MSFFTIQASADAAIVSALGQSVTYSRPISQSFDALAPFTVSAIIDTAGQYADPRGTFAGAASFLIGAIPNGPQKGDLLIPSETSYSVIAGRTYQVQEVASEAIEGMATVLFRWTGQ